jgi:hypothetical protein
MYIELLKPIPATVGERLPKGRLIARGRALGARPSLGRPSRFSMFLISMSLVTIIGFGGVLAKSGSFDSPVVIGGHQADSPWYDLLPASLVENQGRKDTLQRRVESAYKIQYVAEIIRERFQIENAQDLAITIVSESDRAGVDPFLVAAIVKVESSFRSNARSTKGAMGLMQVIPATARYVAALESPDKHDRERLNDPSYNIRIGVRYIKYLYSKFNGNIEHTLIAYNWGPGKLSGALKSRSRIPTSTVKYAESVLTSHRRWKSEFALRRSIMGETAFDTIVG